MLYPFPKNPMDVDKFMDDNGCNSFRGDYSQYDITPRQRYSLKLGMDELKLDHTDTLYRIEHRYSWRP